MVNFLMPLHNFRNRDRLLHDLWNMCNLFMDDRLFPLNDPVDHLWLLDFDGLNLVLDLRVHNRVVNFRHVEGLFFYANLWHLDCFFNNLRLGNLHSNLYVIMDNPFLCLNHRYMNYLFLLVRYMNIDMVIDMDMMVTMLLLD